MMKDRGVIFKELVTRIGNKGLERFYPPGSRAIVQYEKKGTKGESALVGTLSLLEEKNHIVAEPGYKGEEKKEKRFTIRPVWDEESGQCRLSINYPYASQEGYSIGCDQGEIVAQEFLQSFSSPESDLTTD